MSIRFRFTLLYNAILALMLAIFGISLYSIQARTTYDALKQDLMHNSERLVESVLKTVNDPGRDPKFQPPEPQAPMPFENFSGEQVFKEIPEREIVRVLDAEGNLVASPFGRTEDNLPLSTSGLAAAQNQQEVWETTSYLDQNMLIYTMPVISNGELSYIIQIARPLTERDRSLKFLATTFLTASLLTLLVAFGIGWIFSGLTLRPIQRLTRTAKTIGEERDFTRRVTYTGPQDEVGQLATTLNAMLTRLQDAYLQVAHALELQRNFVADVSHELRTPLTTLRGNLGLLRRQPRIDPEEEMDILTDMVDESDRLIRLVNDLLVLARADAGRNLAKDPVAIKPLLEETCRQAQQLAPGRAITLEVDDLSVLADRDAFKQVLLVALDNAIKHSKGDIAVSALRNEDRVAIRVKDTGDGISPETLEHLFDRFYRGEDAANLPGLGLGLAIAKSLVEGLGGEIRMESEVGKGSALIFDFPVL